MNDINRKLLLSLRKWKISDSDFGDSTSNDDSDSDDSKYDRNYFPKAAKIKILTEFDWHLKKDNMYSEIPTWLKFTGEKSYQLEIISEDLLELSVRWSTECLSPDLIEKIEAPYMKKAYELRKKQKGASELILYHATIPSKIESILMNNLNWRLNGTSRGHKHGKGVSFSPRPEFANRFCKSVFDKRMLVVKVLYKNAHIGHDYHKLPDPGYDTTKSLNGNVYVKFEDSEFLPIYIIHY